MNNSEQSELRISASASTGPTPAVLQSTRFSSISSSGMQATTTRTASIHESLSSQTATMTITQQNDVSMEVAQNDEVLPLTLRGRLAVTWYVQD